MRIGLILVLMAGLALPGQAPAAQPSIKVVGTPELYLSHTDMTCDASGGMSQLDVTDVPVTAFRREDGTVVVVSGNQNNHYLEGPSVDQASRTSCGDLVKTVNDPEPSHFNARRWLFAIHATDYQHVLGFVHNEYHGDDHFPDKCKVSNRRNFECWYGASTLVVSNDGGLTFDTPPVPDNVLASLPWKFSTSKLRSGSTSPKVVGNPHDKLIYVMIDYFDMNRKIKARQCLLRGDGKDLNGWRAWDGKGFSLDMESPYVAKRSGDCTPVLPFVVNSVKYLPQFDQFVALGVRRDEVVYTFSRDLVKWSKPQVLMKYQIEQTWEPGKETARAYFSLLDPDSSSINFDTLEKRPYIYFVQFGSDPRNFRRQRDVYRQRIEIR